MKKIIIKDFGPISHLEFEIKKINVFFGPQASGKSTVCKLIYFFYDYISNLVDRIYNQYNILTKQLSNSSCMLWLLDDFDKNFKQSILYLPPCFLLFFSPHFFGFTQV